MTKPLNIGMIGYGFMGRAHSNAYSKVSHFFDLEYQPLLKAVCARSEENAKAFAAKWGYESIETDWRKLIDEQHKNLDAVTVSTPDHNVPVTTRPAPGRTKERSIGSRGG